MGSNTHQFTLSAPVGGDDLDRCLDQLGADRGHLVAMVGVDHQFEGVRAVAARDLGVGDGVIMARLGGEEARESVEATVHQVEVQMVRQRAAPIGASGGVEQLADAGDVVTRHLAFDLEASHGGRVPV